MHGSNLARELAPVSISGRREERAIAAAVTGLRETPVAVRRSRYMNNANVTCVGPLISSCDNKIARGAQRPGIARVAHNVWHTAPRPVRGRPRAAVSA